MAQTNNKAYYLTFAVDEFENNHAPKLGNCLRDIQYWSGLWRDYYDYVDSFNGSHFLYNGDATLKKLACALLKLSLDTNAGDVVSIAISTHGLYKKPNLNKGYNSKHSFLTHKEHEFVSSSMLNFLLSFFKKDVRINLILDICHSSGFAGHVYDDTLTQQEKDMFSIAFASLDSNTQTSLNQLMDTHKNKSYSANILEIASVSRFLEAPDGWIAELSKDHIFWGPFWKNYTASKYREYLEYYMNNKILYETIPMLKAVIQQAYNHHTEVRDYLDDFMKSENVSTTSELFNIILEHPFTMIPGFFQALITRMYQYMARAKNHISEDEKKKFQSRLNCFYNGANYIHIFHHKMPLIAFYGPKSDNFKNQYVFQV